jgi:hypothetical protein
MERDWQREKRVRILRGIIVDLLIIFLLVVLPIRTLIFGLLGSTTSAVLIVAFCEFSGILCYLILIRPATFRRFPSLKRWFIEW